MHHLKSFQIGSMKLKLWLMKDVRTPPSPSFFQWFRELFQLPKLDLISNGVINVHIWGESACSVHT